MNPIKLIEPEHIYLNTITGEEYESESRVISFFKKKFDKEYYAKKKAYEELVPNFNEIYKKYKKEDHAVFEELDKHVYNKLVLERYIQDYLSRWDKKSAKANKDGTKFHKIAEEIDIKNGYAINPIDNSKYEVFTNETIDFDNLVPGCYLEIALADHEHKIAGTADKFFLVNINGKLFCDMFDYKTNENLFKKPFNKFLKPFNSYEESKINTYTFQQSAYQYMLSLNGVMPRSSEILYSPNKDITKIGRIKLPILMNESIKMHKIYYEKKINNQ